MLGQTHLHHYALEASPVKISYADFFKAIPSSYFVLY